MAFSTEVQTGNARVEFEPPFPVLGVSSCLLQKSECLQLCLSSCLTLARKFCVHTGPQWALVSVRVCVGGWGHLKIASPSFQVPVLDGALALSIALSHHIHP